MTRPEETRRGGVWRGGILAALIVVTPFWVAVWWLLVQPLAWWLVS